MKRTLTVCFATVLLTTGLAKATAEPALKLHFAGIENLIQRGDAKTLKAVWAQKETRTLRTEALGKLAKHLAAQSGKGVSIFNSILPDIGLGETYLTIAPGERTPEVTFMAAKSKKRGGAAKLDTISENIPRLDRASLGGYRVAPVSARESARTLHAEFVRGAISIRELFAYSPP